MEKGVAITWKIMDNIELIVINKWKKWGKNDFVCLWISLVRLEDETEGESK